MAIFSKDEIRKMIADRPAGTSPQEIIDGLIAKGHVLEGYVQKGDKGEKGDPGPMGLPGPRGPIGPSGPMGLPGRNGKDGAKGEPGRDGRDGRDGQDGLNGKDGRDGRDGSPDSGDEIIDKINSAEGKIDASRIRDLPTSQIVYQGGGGFPETQIKAGSNTTVTKDAFGNWVIASTGGSGSVTVETPTGTVDGSNDTFTVTSEPKWIVSDGMTYFAGAGYTYSAPTVTMTTPPYSYIRSIY